MEQYILKSALVAEIENLVNTNKKCQTRNSYEEGLKDGRLIGYKDALHKINSLEVKELDLLSLTWEDMLIIHKCIKDATNYHLSAFQTVEGQQKIYEDVLKRFKERKEK